MMTDRRSCAVDPQQRLLLECTFEALESAGIPKHTVVGDKVGVFIGGSLSEYETHLSRDADSMPMYQSTGQSSPRQLVDRPTCSQTSVLSTGIRVRSGNAIQQAVSFL